jgi:hypothetical protein
VLLRALAARTWVVAWAAGFSFLAGVLCWIWQPALVLYPPLLAFLVWRRQELHRPLPLILAVAPVTVGLAPMLIYNLANDWASVQEIQAKVTAHVEESSFFFGSPARTFLAFLLLALGGGDEHVGWPNPLQAILVATAFPGLLVLVIRWQRWPRLDQRAWAVVALLLAAVVDAAAAHQTVRHLTPAALVGFTLLGSFLTLALRIAGPTVTVVVAALTLVVPNVWLARTATFTFDIARAADVQAAIQALDVRGLRTGYTDYWAAYPVEYFSQERLVLAPSLPSPLGGFDRYAPYSYEVGLVENPRELFLLVDNRCVAAPYEQALTEVGATFQAERVARWTLLWDFQSAPGREAETLDTLHTAIAAASTC